MSLGPAEILVVLVVALLVVPWPRLPNRGRRLPTGGPRWLAPVLPPRRPGAETDGIPEASA